MCVDIQSVDTFFLIDLKDFSQILKQWYALHGRHDLPWRSTNDPYLIWLSEIILQQTRVVQGYDYYLRFVKHFPTLYHLASATEDEVLALWQGLGYYSRGRNLLKAAKQMVEMGGFPMDYASVRSLKGVGDYTAAAICSFAYNQPYAVVDGNVYRVLSRFMGIETPIDTTAGKKEFSELAYSLLDPSNSRIYNSAIMDFGALQCKPQQPDCRVCPLAGGCQAYHSDTVEHFPVKSKRTEVKHRYFVYIYLRLPHGKTLFRKRDEGDIWAGLYEPLLLEFTEKPTDQLVMNELSKIIHLNSTTLTSLCQGVKHVLTHRCLWIDFWELKLADEIELPGFVLLDEENRSTYAVPQILLKLFQSLPDQ